MIEHCLVHTLLVLSLHYQVFVVATELRERLLQKQTCSSRLAFTFKEVAVQGKFLIEHVPNLTGSPNKPAHVLKYAVELAVNATPRFIDLMEPLIERSIAEDLPGSLDALRNAAESLYSKVRSALP